MFATEELLAGRLLRCLSAASICDEVDQDRYRANDVTRYLVAPGGSGAIKHHFDMVIPVLSRLVEDIRQDKLDQFPMMPGQISPFQRAHQMPKVIEGTGAALAEGKSVMEIIGAVMRTYNRELKSEARLAKAKSLLEAMGTSQRSVDNATVLVTTLRRSTRNSFKLRMTSRGFVSHNIDFVDDALEEAWAEHGCVLDRLTAFLEDPKT
ncbi:MAG: hypothetical protein M1816_001702 [Peltula sp. TS41687]|nr:MAG: hypothetical protein M1816_001702 [Peltula sp. TS41687]